MFDITQPISDDGDRNEERHAALMEGVLTAFAESPESKTFTHDPQSVGHWAEMFLNYYFNYLSDTLSEASVRDVREVVFELIPRKVSVDPEVAPELIAELRAFWAFLGREYRLPQAGDIVALLSDDSILKLKNLLSDPSNFGMAKSFFMQGKEAGFDMTTQEGLNQFMAVYNATLANRSLPNYQADVDKPMFEVPGRPTHSTANRKERRKSRKAERQARKRNRR